MSGIPLPCYLRGFRMSGIPLPCYLRCFQAPSCPLPCYLRCFQASVTMLFAVFSSAQMSVTMLFAVFSCAQMSVTMLFAVFSSAQMSVTMLIAVFSCAQMSVTMLFAVFSDAQGVRGVLRLYYKQSTFQPRKLRVSAAYSAYYVCATKVDFPATEAPRVRGVLHLYYKSRLSSHGSSGCPLRTTFVLQKSTFQPRKLRASPAYYICTTKVDFPATEAPGVRGVLRLYYKTRLSSHGSSGCPRRTARLYYKKSTFQPRKLRVSAAYCVCTTKSRLSSHGSSGCPRRTIRLYYKSRLSSHGSSACPRRTTFVLQKVDFPATEAPRVRGVLRLYYKSRLSSHGSSGCPRRTIRLYYKSRLSSHGSSACPRRTTFVLQKSTFQPRKLRVSAAYYVCTTKVDFPATEVPGVLRLYYTSRQKKRKTLRFSHRDHAKTRRGVTFACQETQKHDGFGTAPTPKPAEGLLLYVTKRKNTTVLAPRQRRNPQRVVCGHGKKYQKRRFSHRDPAITRRGLSADLKKSKKTTVLAPRPRRNPQRVVRANQET